MGIVEPAVLLKRYQPATSVSSHFLIALGNNALRSSCASTEYELHSGPVCEELKEIKENIHEKIARTRHKIRMANLLLKRF